MKNIPWIVATTIMFCWIFVAVFFISGVSASDWNIANRWPNEARTAKGAFYGTIKSGSVTVMMNPKWTDTITVNYKNRDNE